MAKKALITGVGGQDGFYLSKLLLSKGYEVHGLTRSTPRDLWEGSTSVYSEPVVIKVHYGDVASYPTVWRLIAEIQPDEIYHLAAQSHVGLSFEDDFGTFEVNTRGTHCVLSAVKELKPDAKVYFAGSGESYGNVLTVPQNEDTPFNPISPYSISKTSSYYWVRMFREAYGLFACTGIFFNHESPMRDTGFVTRKITHTAARIKSGKEKELKLGNLDAKRDWGFAGDYVEAMWLMLQAGKPEDYVIATGEVHTVREFVEETFQLLNMPIKWQGQGIDETGINIRTGEVAVRVDKSFFRPAEVNLLQGDPSKAKEKLGWTPNMKFKEIVFLMVNSDLKLIGLSGVNDK